MLRKRALSVLVTALCMVGPAVVFAQPEEDIQKHSSCKYCGMDREKFAHSRMLLEYDDGTVTPSCSIHCVAIDLAVSIDKTPKSIHVADYGAKNLIDAEKAYWVIGGAKPGVMTRTAKWAFEKKEDAEAFLKDNGGNMGTFDDAMKATYEDMYSDTKMIRDKRAKMRAIKAEEAKK